MVFFDTMKTANVADLRNDFQKVAAWISDGETVAIKRRGKLFATLSPAHGLNEPAMPKIDFAAQLKKIWGDKVFILTAIAAEKKTEPKPAEPAAVTPATNAPAAGPGKGGGGAGVPARCPRST